MAVREPRQSALKTVPFALSLCCQLQLAQGAKPPVKMYAIR